MKTKLLLTLLAVGLLIVVYGQEPTNSFNMQQDCDTTLNVMDISMESNVKLYQKEPTHKKTKTMVTVEVPETGYVCIKISDMQGRTIISSRKFLEKGKHNFKYIPGSGEATYFTTVWQGQSNSIKILHEATTTIRPSSIQYIGDEINVAELR